MGKVRNNMAKRNRKRSKRKMTLPIAPLAGLAVGMVPAVDVFIKSGGKDLISPIDHLSSVYTGYGIFSKDWRLDRLAQGLMPLVGGLLIHKFVGGAPLNLNKSLAQAGVPIIRI